MGLIETPLSRTETPPVMPEAPEEFASRLDLKFKRPVLLMRALTHRSYLNEHSDEVQEDNERLEFLGDAVLDFLVGAWLYNHYPEKREGALTRLRSALVRTDQLASFASQLDFGAAMRLGRGESSAGGRQRSVLLCATFEAVIGALYLDSGIEAVKAFVEPLIAPVAEQIISTQGDQDAKSLLQENVQARGLGSPRYRTVAASGPEHQKIFVVEVLVGDQVLSFGRGSSKQAAAKAAAQSALALLDDNPDLLPLSSTLSP
jgi:ribonuclease-3